MTVSHGVMVETKRAGAGFCYLESSQRQTGRGQARVVCNGRRDLESELRGMESELRGTGKPLIFSKGAVSSL